MDDSAADLVARWRQGDEQAAGQLFRRYAPRLRALARSRLPAPLARLVDPDDVVQSACGSFFAGVRDGRFVFDTPGDIWRLLAAMTINKLQRHVERHATAKRALSRQRHFGGESSLQRLGAPNAADATPSRAAALSDSLEQAMQGLDGIHRRIVELRLQNYQVEEIAALVGRSERTVRRVLDEMKERLRQAGIGDRHA
jgi:RNA polymerase sigma-70 factor (ECF subfamily)